MSDILRSLNNLKDKLNQEEIYQNIIEEEFGSDYKEFYQAVMINECGYKREEFELWWNSKKEPVKVVSLDILAPVKEVEICNCCFEEPSFGMSFVCSSMICKGSICFNCMYLWCNMECMKCKSHTVRFQTNKYHPKYEEGKAIFNKYICLDVFFSAMGTLELTHGGYSLIFPGIDMRLAVIYPDSTISWSTYGDEVQLSLRIKNNILYNLNVKKASNSVYYYCVNDVKIARTCPVFGGSLMYEDLGYRVKYDKVISW